ncbi:MAG TPA: hypothetical protein VMC42_05530 [Methanoregulaceae archaeon]|nr:hypothetical protein [Methanoregulaceae archaeon]
MFTVPGGSPAGTYTTPQTGENNEEIIRRSGATIPGSVLPAGTCALVATEVSGETARTDVSIPEYGGSYPAYRNRQAMEAAFFPVDAIHIAGLAVLLAAGVVKRE